MPASQPIGADPLTLHEFSALVEAIYRGPLESPPWKGFLESIRSRLAANYAVLVLLPASLEHPQVLVIAGPYTTEATDAYNSRFFEMDPFVGLPHNQTTMASELLGEGQWFDSLFYRDYLKPLDIRDVMGADLVTAEGEECRLRVTRTHGGAPFGARDKALCELMLPHLRQAVHLCSNLNLLDIERKLLASTIDRMQVGTVMLDSKGEKIGRAHV